MLCGLPAGDGSRRSRFYIFDKNNAKNAGTPPQLSHGLRRRLRRRATASCGSCSEPPERPGQGRGACRRRAGARAAEPLQDFRRRQGARQRRPRGGARRGARAPRAERLRQVDADQDPVGLPRAGSGRASCASTGRRWSLPLQPGEFRRHRISFVHQHLGADAVAHGAGEPADRRSLRRGRGSGSRWDEERRGRAQLFERYGLDLDPRTPVVTALAGQAGAACHRARRRGDRRRQVATPPAAALLDPRRADAVPAAPRRRAPLRAGQEHRRRRHERDLRLARRRRGRRDHRPRHRAARRPGRRHIRSRARSSKQDIIQLIVGRRLEVAERRARRHSALAAPTIAIEDLSGGTLEDLRLGAPSRRGGRPHRPDRLGLRRGARHLVYGADAGESGRSRLGGEQPSTCRTAARQRRSAAASCSSRAIGRMPAPSARFPSATTSPCRCSAAVQPAGAATGIRHRWPTRRGMAAALRRRCRAIRCASSRSFRAATSRRRCSASGCRSRRGSSCSTSRRKESTSARAQRVFEASSAPRARTAPRSSAPAPTTSSSATICDRVLIFSARPRRERARRRRR